MQIAQAVPTIDGERDWYLSPLHSPFKTNDRGMNSQSLGDLNDHGIFGVNRIARSPIAVWTRRRTDRTETNRDHPIIDHEFEQFRLLKMRMQFHFVAGRFDPGVAQ